MTPSTPSGKIARTVAAGSSERGTNVCAPSAERVVALADGEQRYSEIARTIAGVSQKMLTQTLRNLERDGILIRSITPAVPVRVSDDARRHR